MVKRKVKMGNLGCEIQERQEWMEKQFDVEKPGCVCLDCGKRATEGEYSCGSCSECGGPIGPECAGYN